MSAGTVHFKASLILANGFLLGGIVFTDVHCFEYAAGALLGIPLSPDLDVDSGFIMDRIIRRRLGKPGIFIWRNLWYFYRRSLKHGRELSHFPVISTLGRLLYLYFFIVAVPHTAVSYTGLFAWNLHDVLDWYTAVILAGYRVILGLMCSDLIHWALDIMTTEHKKSRAETYVAVNN